MVQPNDLDHGDLPLVIDCLRYYAGYADKIAGEVVPIWPQNAFDYTLDEPYGVIGILEPWNGPVISFGQMIAPAMAGGNTCIIKPTEFAPFSCLFLGELALERFDLRAGKTPAAQRLLGLRTNGRRAALHA